MNLRTLAVVVALAAPISSLAQEAEEPESPWSGKATLGYLATSGNTETSTLNTGLEVGYTTGKWLHEFTAAAVKASESDTTTAESYDAGWKSERKITDHDYLFGRLDWRKTRFGAFDTQFSQTVGYGRRLIDTDKHSLNAELGAGPKMRASCAAACTTDGCSARPPVSARTSPWRGATRTPTWSR
jgi:putative salt-induced outer membrane protein